MADIFDVVADATRRDLLRVLLERSTARRSTAAHSDSGHSDSGHSDFGHSDAGEISVGELVTHLGLSQPTVSKHLKVLRDHGLVTVREEGQHRYYRMDARPLETLEDWLIPFLGAAVDESGVDDVTTASAAWSGIDVGQTIGRRIAERSHQARAVIHDATDRIQDASDVVAGRLPAGVRHRLFGDR